MICVRFLTFWKSIASSQSIKSLIYIYPRGTGPTTYKSAEERADFVTAIQSLIATGGGDCAELALQGMLNAFNKNPKLGSPMFVFTDAGAKDDTYSMRELVKSYASQYQATINFFTHSSLCHTGIAPFREIASYTSGQIFPLQSHADITKFTDFVGNSLKDSTIIKEGSNNQNYYFVVDGEVNTLLLSLNAVQTSAVTSAALIDPFGVTRSATQTTAYSRVYTIANPAAGQWHLRFPPSSGSNSFIAKSVGNNSIDFTPYFLHQEDEMKGTPILSLSNPVKGNFVPIFHLHWLS